MSTDQRQPAPLIPNPLPGPRPLRFGLAPPVGRDDLLTAEDADADAESNLPRQSQWKPPGPRSRLIERLWRPLGHKALTAFKLRGEKKSRRAFADLSWVVSNRRARQDSNLWPLPSEWLNL